MNYRFTIEARADLAEIRRYGTKHWGEQAARDYLMQLRSTLNVLTSQPEMATPRPDIGTNTFSFPVQQHVIYYLISETELLVFAILHQRMLPSSHLIHRTP